MTPIQTIGRGHNWVPPALMPKASSASLFHLWQINALRGEKALRFKFSAMRNIRFHSCRTAHDSKSSIHRIFRLMASLIQTISMPNFLAPSAPTPMAWISTLRTATFMRKSGIAGVAPLRLNQRELIWHAYSTRTDDRLIANGGDGEITFSAALIAALRSGSPINQPLAPSVVMPTMAISGSKTLIPQKTC